MYRLTLAYAITASVLYSVCSPALSAPRFNDSALTQCIVDAEFTTSCGNTGQDAEYGRDVAYPTDRNGRAGFSFVKLDNEGNALPVAAPSWTCVEDRITGLVWEVKEKPGEPRSESDHYRYKDAVRFIRVVNTQGLCGFKDWRMPTKNEADTLASMALTGDRVAEGLDRAFFNDAASVSWTQSCSTEWCYVTPFYGDSGGEVSRQEGLYTVRAVRGAPLLAGAKRYSASGDKVVDKSTGLTWMRCSIGQEWTGTTCSGKAQRLTWFEALEKAKSLSNDTGEAWRLPSVKELMSLSEYPKIIPSINTVMFPVTPSKSFWTSSVFANGLPWYVSFYNGFQNSGWEGQNFLNPIYVRLVLDTR